MVCEDTRAVEVVNGDIEKALDLVSVKIHCKHAVSAGCCDKIGAKLCRDRISRLGFSVLSGIAEVRHNRRDPRRRSTLHGVDHNQHFHKVVVYGGTGRLNYKAIAASYRLVKRNRDLAVREVCAVALAERKSETSRNTLSNVYIRITRENFNVLTVKIHC